jgi:hypothetical protein
MTDPRTLARELVSRTRWSPERLATHQRERLAALVRHAVAASPYYREVFGPDPAGAPAVFVYSGPEMASAVAGLVSAAEPSQHIVTNSRAGGPR